MDSFQRLSAALAARYRLERELGQGGMATVYLAADLKHQRQVAIKVLRPELAAVLGAERFVQEIATTAALQHPNILPLFDSGNVDGFLYYVMPYVEGESLRDTLNRETQLGVEEAVKLVSEVADALQYAHGRGVVHRDIKPENILMHAGRPMVADFGIALAVSAAAGGRMTETGLSLGTPHYMSPEQATAEKTITNRSDIYSLGAVLYELLTGTPPHVGATAQQIIMKIIAEPVAAVTEVRKAVPGQVVAALAKALEKLPADRFASAAEFADALEGRLALPAAAVGAHEATREDRLARVRASRRRTLFEAVGILIFAGVALWGWLRPRRVPPLREEVVSFGSKHVPAMIAFGSAIAPDGSAIVYPDSTRPDGHGLWIKERDELDPRLLASFGGGAPAQGPAFSPDGQWIVYSENGALEKVARTGGAPVPLADSLNATGAAWLDDGTIAFIGRRDQALFRTNAAGEPATRVLPADSGRRMLRIAPVPGAEAVLVGTVDFSGTEPTNPREIAVDLRSGTAHEVTRDGLGAWIVPGGTIVYGQGNGSLLAAPFDRRTLTVEGSPVSALVGVGILGPGALVAAVFGANGDLLYSEGNATQSNRLQLVSVKQGGSAVLLDSTWNPVFQPKGGLDLSPDGTRLALSVSDSAHSRSDIYVVRLPSGPAVRLTSNGTTNIRPRWSPDDTTVLYVSDAGGKEELWTRRADLSDTARMVVSDSLPVWEGHWSPDARWIVYRTDHKTVADAGNILAIRTGEDGTPDSLVTTTAEEFAPTISPDGHWMAYVSSKSTGRAEVYVCRFPNAHEGGPWPVSSDGGTEPRWSNDGNAIFYRDEKGQMIEAHVNLNGTFRVKGYRPLFDATPYAPDFYSASYAVQPHDAGFVMLRRKEARDTSGRWVLLENWMPELQAKLKGSSGR